ncbi:MAG: hypothetical protein JOY64_00635 [Alphaproteobacteria bacterium]|nr:hypothetical protein [Alphaproteobacteria bacterium]MBV8406110.1 hypothetical protein [Alphaproteobacteria bacterium]
MKSAVLLACTLPAGASLAQVSPGVVDKLQACSALLGIERVECLDRVANELGPRRTSPQQPQTPKRPLVTEWVVSETTSPLDYSPVAIAISMPTDSEADFRLSIRCRGGRSELVILSNAGFTRRPEDYAFSYSIEDAGPIGLPLALAATGPGLALKADPAGFLDSLPRDGNVTLRLNLPNGAVQARYRIDQLKAVSARMAPACHWPQQPVQPDGGSVPSIPQRRP